MPNYRLILKSLDESRDIKGVESSLTSWKINGDILLIHLGWVEYQTAVLGEVFRTLSKDFDAGR